MMNNALKTDDDSKQVKKFTHMQRLVNIKHFFLKISYLLFRPLEANEKIYINESGFCILNRRLTGWKKFKRHPFLLWKDIREIMEEQDSLFGRTVLYFIDTNGYFECIDDNMRNWDIIIQHLVSKGFFHLKSLKKATTVLGYQILLFHTDSIIGIGIEMPDQTINAITLHIHKGNEVNIIEETLKTYYSTFQKADHLISLGDLYSLAPNPDPTFKDFHTLSQPQHDVTIAYHRDCQPPPSFCKRLVAFFLRDSPSTLVRSFKNLDQYKRMASEWLGCDYLFIFKNEQWFKL